MNASREEEERGARLRSRLWGAAVLIAVLVIVLPLLLDGSGSESQFRRIERLREEPPRVLGVDGRPETSADANSRVVEPLVRESAGERAADEPSLRIHVGEDDPPEYMRAPPSERTVQARRATESLSAWIVQAGSFGNQANAVALRDRLRQAGFASFVAPPEAGETLFRVRVGPMIDEAAARRALGKVAALTGLGATLARYP